MVITLHYKFDDDYVEGYESFHVEYEDFKYEVDVPNSDLETKTLKQITEEHRDEAFKKAAYTWMCEYADWLTSNL